MQSSSMTGSPILLILLLLLVLAGVAIAAPMFLRRGGAAPDAASSRTPIPRGSGAGRKIWMVFGGVALVLLGLFGLASLNMAPVQRTAVPRNDASAAAGPVEPAPAVPDPVAAPAAPAGLAAQAAPATAAAPTGLVPGSYACSAFMGIPPNGHLQSMPGFTIAADGAYTHEQGSTGTIAVVQGVLEFHGGALDGQAATFDAGSSGKGSVHIYNESRSRTVIDCDGQG